MQFSFNSWLDGDVLVRFHGALESGLYDIASWSHVLLSLNVRQVLHVILHCILLLGQICKLLAVLVNLV